MDPFTLLFPPKKNGSGMVKRGRLIDAPQEAQGALMCVCVFERVHHDDDEGRMRSKLIE